MNETYSGLHEKLSRLQWLLHKQHLRSHAACGPLANPTRGQGRILALLKMQDGLSTRDLAYLLGLRISSLNELLAKLEKSGYVVREPAESDKRILLVKLTDQGREVSTQKDMGEDIFHCLNAEEQAAFGQYLERVITALEEDSPEEQEESDWLNTARSRLGDEMFDRLIAMKHGGHRHCRGDRFHHGRGDRFHHGRGDRFQHERGRCMTAPCHDNW
jgi:DNA-binding MarR family transcriptional regulator